MPRWMKDGKTDLLMTVAINSHTQVIYYLASVSYIRHESLCSVLSQCDHIPHLPPIYTLKRYGDMRSRASHYEPAADRHLSLSVFQNFGRRCNRGQNTTSISCWAITQSSFHVQHAMVDRYQWFCMFFE